MLQLNCPANIDTTENQYKVHLKIRIHNEIITYSSLNLNKL